MQDGVSVVICAHNSAQRLPKTLSHLAQQPVSRGLGWEVIVVDNASTDGTGEAALSSWPDNPVAPLRVVMEPRAGLCHARIRGFMEARFGTVSFIDDDNWVCSDWVERIARIMRSHPGVGACGGYGIGAYEIEPPSWFDRYHDCFAIGPQGEGPGVLTRRGSCLWGAGVSVRKSAWEHLRKKGFSYLLVGRKGRQLCSGEDLELSYALRLSGWDLYYDPLLTYQHFMPAGRLCWPYLRRLNRGFGLSSVGLDPYQFAVEGTLSRCRHRLLQTWARETYWDARKLQRDRAEMRSQRECPDEGDPSALRVDFRRGRLSALLRGPRLYAQYLDAILNARWLTTPMNSCV